MAYPAPENTELVQRIGAGSVFHVALVRAEGRLVICKRLTPRAVNEPAGRAAIVREAMALSLVRHPALPVLIRVGTDAHGPFVLETRVEGVSLRNLLEGWRSRGKRVPPLLVRHIARAAIESLAEIHELENAAGPVDLIHGDLGPDHIIMAPLGDARFVDFGAARFAGMEEALMTDDRGTLPYVAPEVARRDALPGVTGDVYALAAALLFFASGRHICAARDEAAMLIEIGERGVQVDLLDRADGLALGERAALRAALEFDPAARIKTARDLLEAFDVAGAAGPAPITRR